MLGVVLALTALSPTSSAPPSWSRGFEEGSNVGGLLSAVLAPTKGFGKLVMVLLALSTSCACAPSMYTFGESDLYEWICWG